VEAVSVPSGTWEAAFLPPDFRAPLDRDAAVASIPESATISGMFLMPLVEEAKRRGFTLPSARDRYVTFSFYPLREHARLLLETCERLYPDRSLREALRKLGRGAPRALVASTLGKVVLGSVEGPHDVIAAMAKAYPLNARPSRVTVLESARGKSVVRLEDIYYFVDCHHVGAFEGALNFAGVKGTVLYAKRGKAAGDLLIQWSD
jgi:uncharacterized protein (TIGR02265 family)